MLQTSGSMSHRENPMTANSIPLKHCGRKKACVNPLGSLLPETLDHFRYSKLGRNHLQSICRECERADAREYQRQRRKDPEYRERQNALVREYNRRPDVKERVRNMKREPRYVEANRERCRAYRKANARGLDERYKEHKKSYRQTQQGKTTIAAIRLKRRALERGLPVEFTGDDWKQALNYFNGHCAYCGAPQGLWNRITADHFIPLTADNSPGTIATNIVPACKTCNCSKSNKDVAEWLSDRFGKRKAHERLQAIKAYFEWVKESTASTRAPYL